MPEPQLGGQNQRTAVTVLPAISETLLWPLYNRASEARRPNPRLRDPHAIRIMDAIDYDFARSFGKPDYALARRAILVDRLLRNWLAVNPGGQVVALGDGLDTQCFRVDDRKLRWLSVDLPEAVALRRQFIPDAECRRSVACSALDLRWMNEIASGDRVFVTAMGLLMYLQPVQVATLVRAIAERFPGSRLVFDTIPARVVRKSANGWNKTPHYTSPPMPWGINRSEIHEIRKWHPQIAAIDALAYHGFRNPLSGALVGAMIRLPGLRDLAPMVVSVRLEP